MKLRFTFSLVALLLALCAFGASAETDDSPPVMPPAVLQPAPYEPPAGAKRLLGKISLKDAVPIDKTFGGGKKLLMLPGGVLYIDSDLDTDDDGSPLAPQIDPDGQVETSYTYPGITGQAQYVDALKVPFFVLPGGFYKEQGIGLGDLGVLIYKDKIVYGFFGDVGPKKKIGEASVKAVETLGHNPWNKAHTKIVSGIDSDVVCLVFPGSALTNLTPDNVVARVEAGAKKLFKGLGGVVEP